MPEDKNIYVDLEPVPGSSNKVYSVFVFKQVFKKIIYTFSQIDKKVSRLSEFKSVSQKLADVNNWNQGRPLRIPSRRMQNDKYFCELSVTEIAILRDMVYAHKSKFNGGTIMMEGAELKREGSVTGLMAKARSLVKPNPLARELPTADSARRSSEQEKFLKSINADFDRKFDSLNKRIKELLDGIEGFITKCNLKRVVEGGIPRRNSTGGLGAPPLSESSRRLMVGERVELDFGGELPNSPQDTFTLPKGDARFSDAVLNKMLHACNEVFRSWSSKLGYVDLRKPAYQAGLGVLRENPTINPAECIGHYLTLLGELLKKMSDTISTYFQVKGCVDRGWKIVSVLGAGGYGCVVKFLNDKGKERALKLFMDGDGKDVAARAKEEEAIKFMHEAFGHDADKKPPVKKYFNVPKEVKGGYGGTERGLSMKLAADVLDADKFVNRDPNRGDISDISIKTFKNLAKQLLKGLMKLHDAGKVHVDIKPGNVHIMKDGSFRIADFGLLEDADKALPGDRHYTHPDWSKKPVNMASAETPENKMKNDVYAVGCTLYDILLGRRADVSEYTNINVKVITGSRGKLGPGQLPQKFSDPSMTVDNITELLKFISYLCKPSLSAVPTAREALMHSFLR